MCERHSNEVTFYGVDLLVASSRRAAKITSLTFDFCNEVQMRRSTVFLADFSIVTNLMGLKDLLRKAVSRTGFPDVPRFEVRAELNRENVKPVSPRQSLIIWPGLDGLPKIFLAKPVLRFDYFADIKRPVWNEEHALSFHNTRQRIRPGLNQFDLNQIANRCVSLEPHALQPG